MQLSDRAKELIPKARIVSFHQWEAYLSAAIAQRFRDADDASRYLTDEDFSALQPLAEPSVKDVPLEPINLQLSRQLRDLASEIVTDARGQVLGQFPGITDPGGALYPQMRADACWRDFWQFLRCVSYGGAGNNSAYLRQEGLGYMALLYEELKVPLPAMVAGIKALAVSSLNHCQPAHQDDISGVVNEYFDPLIQALESF